MRPKNSDILELLRAIFGRVPASSVATILMQEFEPQTSFPRRTIGRIEQTLARGTTDWLIRAGGWRDVKHLSDGLPREGRLWQRREPDSLGLRFTSFSLRLLSWLWSTGLRAERTREFRVSGPPAEGDLLFAFLSYRMLRQSGLSLPWAEVEPFRDNALCQLMYATDYRNGDLTASSFRQAVEPWLREPSVYLLESIQPELLHGWKAMELEKSRLRKPQDIISFGNAQASVLDGYLEAIDETDRRDLVQFLLELGCFLLSAQRDLVDWVRAIDVSGLRMEYRAKVYRAATSTMSRYIQLSRWEEEARAVAFHDEEYEASQMWKANWERWNGQSCSERARRIVQELEPMRTG